MIFKQTRYNKKGRGFALCSELCALSYQPPPRPFSNKKERYTGKDIILTGKAARPYVKFIIKKMIIKN
jgi:hypothetical protein